MTNNKDNNIQYESWMKRALDPSFMHRLLAKLIGFWLHIPFFKTWVQKRFSLMCFYVAMVHNRGEYARLYRIIVDLLEHRYYRQEKNSQQWWFFMHLIVAFMQEQQIRSLMIYPDLEEKLVSLGKVGPLPHFGYHVAYCYVGFSLWMFERGAVNEALNLVRHAAKADPTWGYPEYLIGWFGLFAEGVDIVLHFSNAVLLDWNFLHRMKKDRTCQQFPEIIKKVQQQVLIRDKNSSDDKLSH